MTHKLFKNVPALLCLMHILPAIAVIILESSGYYIWQAHGAWYHWTLAVATLFAALHAITRKPEWNVLNSTAALLLPLCCLADIAFAAGHQSSVYLPMLTCMFASIPLFFRVRARRMMKVPLGMLSLLALYFCAFGSFLEIVGFTPHVTTLCEVSPNGDKIAVVECIDEGALGGRVHGYIYRYRPESVFDEYIRFGKQVMDISFLYPDEIVLYWKDNNTAVFNNGEHDAENLLK